MPGTDYPITPAESDPIKGEAMKLLERLERFGVMKNVAMKPLESLERLNRLKSIVPDLAAGKFSFGQIRLRLYGSRA